ncbi:hypothetical protein [Rhizobium sp. RU20A]|nr:hypothetical protein [Rhizobium sp. RU20A]
MTCPPELTAWESTLDRFIWLDKGDFIGKAALVRRPTVAKHA